MQRSSSTYCFGVTRRGNIPFSAWFDSPEPRAGHITTPARIDLGQPPYLPLNLGTSGGCGVTPLGALHCWGSPYDSSDVEAGDRTGIFGSSEYSQEEVPLRPTEIIAADSSLPIVDIAYTGRTMCILREQSPGNRQLYCWGWIRSAIDPRIEFPMHFEPGVSDWREVAASFTNPHGTDEDTVCALRGNGEVRCIGARLEGGEIGFDGLLSATEVVLIP